MGEEEVKRKERKEQRVERAKDASAQMPEEGWQHESGKQLEAANAGDRVSGIVTNELHGRFWVNVGFAYDATFKSAPGRFAVGDEIVGLEIVSADTKQRRLAIKITNDTRLKSRTAEEQ